MTEIIVEGECVAQGRPRTTRTGHVYTPQKSRAYRDKVKAAAMKVMNGHPPTSFALCVEIKIIKGIPTSWSRKRQEGALEGEIKPLAKPDIDNYTKMLLDGMNGIVYEDDSQVVQLKAEKLYGDMPRAIIRIYPVF